MCGNGSLLIATRPLTPTSIRLLQRANTGRKPSGSGRRHALRGINFNTRTNRAKMHNANTKTCKCACAAINLGMYYLNLTYVTVAISVDRAPAEV
eukprot:6187256-Pleurochrysis_carterae.AAC.1